MTATVIARGHSPRLTIGSVNASEFLVTIAQALTFVVTVPHLISQHWRIIVGLLSGGVISAPLAAFVCRRVLGRVIMALVGSVIIILSLRTLILAWAWATSYRYLRPRSGTVEQEVSPSVPLGAALLFWVLFSWRL